MDKIHLDGLTGLIACKNNYFLINDSNIQINI
jgi:hypothetical protein